MSTPTNSQISEATLIPIKFVMAIGGCAIGVGLWVVTGQFRTENLALSATRDVLRHEAVINSMGVTGTDVRERLGRIEAKQELMLERVDRLGQVIQKYFK